MKLYLKLSHFSLGKFFSGITGQGLKKITYHISLADFSGFHWAYTAHFQVAYNNSFVYKDCDMLE